MEYLSNMLVVCLMSRRNCSLGLRDVLWNCRGLALLAIFAYGISRVLGCYRGLL